MRHCLLLVLLAACAPPESAWERTRALCGDEGWGTALDPTLVGPDETGTIDATLPSVACIDAIAADLHVDIEGFEARDVEELPLGRETFLSPITDAEGVTGLAFPLYAARLLLMHDLGKVGDVDSGQLVQAGLVKRLRKAGGGRRWQVQEALYQVMVDDIGSIVPASKELQTQVEWEGADVRTSWNPELDRLSVYAQGWPGGYASLGATVHELRHDDGPDHIEARGRSADVGPGGSFGWEASAEALVWRGLPEDERAPYEAAMSDWVTSALLRIEQWRDEDGELVQPWAGFPNN